MTALGGSEVFKLFGTIEVGRQKFAADMAAMEGGAKRLASRMGAAFGRAEGFIQRHRAAIQATGRALTAGLTVPLVGAAAATVKFRMDFDKAMTASLAIMGSISGQMRKQMEDSARAVGRTTMFSATQAAESYFYLASAGLDAAQSLAALPEVAKFAQAGNFEMARATDLLTDAQSALGLSTKDARKNIENMVRVSDVLVKANTLSNATVEQFSEALTNKAGAALRLLSKDMEEGVAVLAVFADQGLKGAAAGESLNIVMRDLQRASLKEREEFDRLNISVYDAAGSMRTIPEIFRDMEGAFAGMSDEQLRSTLIMLGFQDRSVSAMMALLGTADAMEQYEKRLRSAGGITEDVAAKQMDNLAAELKLVKDALIDVALELGEVLVPLIRDKGIPMMDALAEKLKGTVEWFGRLGAGGQRAVMVVGAFVAGAGPLLMMLPSLSAGTGIFVRKLGQLIKSMTLAKAGMGAIVLAAAAVGYAAVAATNDVDGFNKELRELEDRAQKARLETQRLPEALQLTWWQAFAQNMGDIVGYEGEITRLRENYMSLWRGEIEMAEERAQKVEEIKEAEEAAAAAVVVADQEAAEKRKAEYSEAAESILSNWQSLLDGMREGQRLTTSEYVQQLQQMLALLDTMNAARRQAGETPLFTAERLDILRRMQAEQVQLIEEQEAAETRLAGARKEWAAEELAERRRLYSYERGMIDLTYQHKMDLQQLVDAEDEEARAGIMREELDALRQRREETELDAQSRLESLRRERELVKGLAAEEEIPEEEARAALEEIFEQMKQAQIELRGEEEKLYEQRRMEHEETLKEMEEQYATLRDEVSETTDLIGDRVQNALNTLESGLLRVISRVALPMDPRPAMAGAVGAVAGAAGGRTTNIYIEGRQVDVEPNVQAILDAAAQALEREHVHGRG